MAAARARINWASSRSAWTTPSSRQRVKRACTRPSSRDILRDQLAGVHAHDDAPRHVLCVGGRARQVPVYRSLVEARGGRLAHVDAVAANCLPALVDALAQADVVILQPGFACRGACLAVEAHCARHGVRCIRLDKSCALAFAQGLDGAFGEV